MQERFSKLEKSNFAALNTSSNDVESVGKKSSFAKKALFYLKCSLRSHIDSIRGLHFLSG